jgi:hypothetical protein
MSQPLAQAGGFFVAVTRTINRFICGRARNVQLCGVKPMKDDIFFALYFAFQSFGNHKSSSGLGPGVHREIVIHPL